MARSVTSDLERLLQQRLDVDDFEELMTNLRHRMSLRYPLLKGTL